MGEVKSGGLFFVGSSVNKAFHHFCHCVCLQIQGEIKIFLFTKKANKVIVLDTRIKMHALQKVVTCLEISLDAPNLNFVPESFWM